MSTEEFRVQPFKDSLINPSQHNHETVGGSKIVVIGKAGTGKSTLIRYLLYLKRNIFPAGVLVSGTEESNKFYSEIIPDLFIYNEYNEDIIKSVISRQKHALNYNIENPWLFLLLDDCTEDKSIFNKPLQQALFKNGRHWKLLYILSLQHGTDIPPAIRTNVDGVFIFRETNENNLKNIYLNYASVIPKFEIFKTYMTAITGDFTALYIDNATQTGEWHEHIYHCKVPDMYTSRNIEGRQMQLGCHEFIEFSKQRYDEAWSIKH